MEDVPNTFTNTPSITENPMFIIGVIALVIAIGIFLRVVFNNQNNEYKHKPED